MPSKKKKPAQTVALSDILEKRAQAVGSDGDRIAETSAVTNGHETVPAQPTARPPDSAGTFFPLARYTSIVGVHTSLLAFVALFLPRTPLPIATTAPTAPVRNADRPQHPFFVALTANPTLTLAWLCVGAVILQAWWGGWVRTWAREMSGHVDTEAERLKQQQQSGWSGESFQAARDAALATFGSSIVLHIVLVLFGAPIWSLCTRTLLLSLLVSVLAVLPAAYTLGLPLSIAKTQDGTQALIRRLTWTRLFVELSPRNPVERTLVYPGVGAVLGSWLGAIPLALDWDRPWQAWPLTPAYGAFIGYIVGAVVTLGINTTMFLAEEGARQRHQRVARLE